MKQFHVLQLSTDFGTVQSAMHRKKDSFFITITASLLESTGMSARCDRTDDG